MTLRTVNQCASLRMIEFLLVYAAILGVFVGLGTALGSYLFYRKQISKIQAAKDVKEWGEVRARMTSSGNLHVNRDDFHKSRAYKEQVEALGVLVRKRNKEPQADDIV